MGAGIRHLELVDARSFLVVLPLLQLRHVRRG